MKRRGFTWIELVVVLGVLLLLAAILFPIFARSRSSDGHGSCQQNVRQIGLAIKQYLSDYDESFPLITVGTGVTEPYGWADACEPYVRNTQLFQCPSDPSQPPTSPATTILGSDPMYSDYFYNSRLSGENESAVSYIASTVMLGDAIPGDARRHSNGGASRQPGVASLVDSTGQPVGAALRHLDGANYAFTDGHVKWLKGFDANTCPSIQNAASGAHSKALGFAVK